MVNEIESEHGTLVANTVTTVTLRVDMGEDVLVINRGSTDMWARFDGTDPEIGGDGALIVPPGVGTGITAQASDDAMVVKLISSGTPDYSVETG